MQLEELVQRIEADSSQFRAEMERVRAELLATGNVSDASAERISRAFLRAMGETRRFNEAARSAPRTYPGLEALETSLESVGQEADLAGDRINASMARIAGTGSGVAGPWKQYGDELRDELAATTVVVGQSTANWTSMFSSTSRQGRFALQNLGFQVADFAVQVGAGTSALRAFSMQAPQALGAFGGVGIAIGTAIAVLGPLAAMFLTSGEKARTSAEALKELEDELERLTEQYRDATGAARELAGERIRIQIEATGQEIFEEQQQAIKDLQEAMQDLRRTGEAAAGVDLFSGFVFGEDVSEQIDEASDAFAAGTIDAAQFREEINRIARAIEGPADEATEFSSELADSVRASAEAAIEARGAYEDLGQSQRDLAAGLSPEKYRALRDELAALTEQARVAAKAPAAGTEERERFDAFIDLVHEAGMTLDEVAEKDPAIFRDLLKGVDLDAAARLEASLDEVQGKIQDLTQEAAVARLPEQWRQLGAALAAAGVDLSRIDFDAATQEMLDAADALRQVDRELAAIDFAEKMRELGDTTAISRLAPEFRAAAAAAREMGMQPFDVPTPEQAANLRLAPQREDERRVADFEDTLRRLEGKQVVLQLPTQDLRDAAEAALALGKNLDGITGPEQFMAALEAMPQDVRELIDLFVALNAAARQVSFAEGLKDQVEQLRLAASFGGRETPQSRLAMARLQARQTMNLGEGETLPPEVDAALVEANTLRTQAQTDAARRARENERAQVEAQLRFAPADLAARQFTGIDTEASRIEQRRLQERQQADLPPTAPLAPEVEEDIIRIERANTALAEYQQAWQVTQQEQGFEQQAAQLEAVVANRGRETEEMRIQATLAQVRITQGEAAAAAVEGEVRALEAARSAAARATDVAGMEDQAEQIRLAAQYAGQESEEYRVQLALLEFKQAHKVAANAEDERAIRLLQEQTTELRQQQALAQVRQEAAQTRGALERSTPDVFSREILGIDTEESRVRRRIEAEEQRTGGELVTQEFEQQVRDAERLNTQLHLMQDVLPDISGGLADIAQTAAFEGPDAAAQQFLGTLQKIAFEMAALALVQGIGNAFIGGGTGGGGALFTPTQLGRQHGGPVRRGQRYEVGEAGEEMYASDRVLRRARQAVRSLPEELLGLETDPVMRDLLGMVEGVDPVTPRRGEAMLLGTRGPVPFVPDEAGQIISNRDLRRLGSTDEGRLFLREVERGSLRGRQHGGPVGRDRAVVAGEVDVELWLPETVRRRLREDDGDTEARRAITRLIEDEQSTQRNLQENLISRTSDDAREVETRRAITRTIEDEQRFSRRDLTDEVRTVRRLTEADLEQVREASRAIELAPLVQHTVTPRGREVLRDREVEQLTETDAEVRRVIEREQREIAETTVTERGQGAPPPITTVRGADRVSALLSGAAAARPVRGPQVVGRRGAEFIIPDFDGVVISHGHLTEIRASEAGRAVLAELGVEGSSGDASAALTAAAPAAAAPVGGGGIGAAASAGAGAAMMAAGGRVRRGQRVGVGERQDELILDQSSLEALTAATSPKAPDTTRVLASAMQAAAVTPAAAQSVPRTEVNVIDQRPHGSPPIEQRRTTGADGREVLTLLVRGAINDLRQSGDFAEMMRQDFGVGPTPR